MVKVAFVNLVLVNFETCIWNYLSDLFWHNTYMWFYHVFKQWLIIIWCFFSMGFICFLSPCTFFWWASGLRLRFFFFRVMFACSVCKFRSFYKEEMETHLESRFHKDHFKFLSSQLSKPTTDFLQVTETCHTSPSQVTVTQCLSTLWILASWLKFQEMCSL